MPDVLGKALMAYHFKGDETPLTVHNDYGDPETMTIQSLYRDHSSIPDYEWVMVDLALGKTLEIGAGCGSHTLLLQDKGLNVTGIEISPGACNVAEDRGVGKIFNKNYIHFDGEKYETITMVMNGIGIIGSLSSLEINLNFFEKLLIDGGQILFDTTDISYLGRKNTGEKYFGDVKFQFEYKEEKGEWFKWLYVDQETLRKSCLRLGWNMQVVFQEEDDHFVVRLYK